MARWHGDAGVGRGRRARPWRGRVWGAPAKAEPLGESLRALLAAMGGTPGRAGLQNLWDNWEAALGAELAELARPLGHRDGRKKEESGSHGPEGVGAVLLLGAEDAMLLQELRFRAEEILARVNGFLGQAYFSEVLVQLPLGRPEPVRSRREQGRAEQRAELDAPAQAPSGIFLENMDSASPVARCYARFAAIRAGKPGQE
ncbi:MAG: DUF721 domain-containing protein [Desulfovibrio sp.]|nr:DUF721 domain-containing protein [Desulfovibrio sp.]